MLYYVRWAALFVGVGLLELGVLTATSQAAPPFRRTMPAPGPAVKPPTWRAPNPQDRVRRQYVNYWRGGSSYKPYPVYPNWWKKRHLTPWPLPVWPYPPYYPPYYPVGPVSPIYPPYYPVDPVQPIYPAEYSPSYLGDPGRTVNPPDSPAKPVKPLYPGPLAREIGYRW